MIELKVLILEDVTLTRMGLTLVIQSIEPERMKRLGISNFKIDTADCATAAYELLERAVSLGEPYDILILDLSIPLGKLGQDDSPDDINEDLLWVDKPENGMDVLRYVKQTGAVKEVIVYSAYPQYDNVAPAFRLGVLDFIAKGGDEKSIEDTKPLQRAVLAAWERVLAKESARTLEERFKTLVPYAEQVLTYQFGIYFSRLIASVSHEVEAMRVSLSDRLGLDAEKDTHDPLIWNLAMIQRSVQEAKHNWGEMPQTRSSEEEGEILKEVVIEDELKKIVGDVIHCLTLKHAKAETPTAGQTRVLSFAHDVPTILREIVVGGLGEVREQDGSVLGEKGDRAEAGRDEDWIIKMNIKVSAMDEKAEVRFEDNMQPINLCAAESINKGLQAVTDNSFGRVWGLSIAQHAALRGGGRIFVEPSQEGNVISYFVPLKY
jgi:DNA-binding NarL/FixJ family response regulator